jgi:hypothetical protein
VRLLHGKETEILCGFFMAEEKNDAAAAQEKDQAVATQLPCRCAAREEHPLKVPYAPGSA